jgi:transposase
MPIISYKVTLTQKERDELHEISHNGKRAARLVLNALVFLAVDRGEHQTVKQSERDIAETLHISPCSINNLKKRFVEEGLDAALERKPMPSRGKRHDGDFEAHLTALACSKAPEGHARWSLRLLADRVVELQYAEKISHETIRQILKKTNLNLGKSKNG